MDKTFVHNAKVALCWWLAIAGSAVGFTSIGFHNNYNPTGASSANIADTAYRTAATQAAQHGHHFQSATAIGAQIERTQLQFDARVGSEAQALNYFRQHSGLNGTLFVVPGANSRVEIVARHGEDAVDILTGDTRGSEQDRVINFKHWKWHPFDVVAALETGPLLGLSLLIAWLSAVGTKRENKRGSERWGEHVPADSAYGPYDPEEGFSLLTPICIDHLGEPWFRVRTYMYKDGDWQYRDDEPTRTIENPDGSKIEKVWRAGYWQDYTPLPPELGAVRVDPTASPQQVAEQWFSFCHSVASWNARCWQRRQDQELRLAQTKELTSGPLSELLQPGSEVVRGLSIESQ
jgi:hypothetical protein